MSYKIGDNVTSPLGNSTEETYRRMVACHSSLKRQEPLRNVPEPFVASLFNEEQKKEIIHEGGLTWFESLAFCSAYRAISEAQKKDKNFRVESERTLFVLSTTKGNIAELEAGKKDVYLGEAARHIADKLGVRTEPLVVCNACISGLSALIVANRMLEQRSVDYAIVCGADVISGFIVSGFKSLGALSPHPCRPFDMERMGLSLGEAAATIVLSAFPTDVESWTVKVGVVRNDAYHNSTPINNGEGLTLALRRVMGGTQMKPSFINAHGTATLFNDQMEAMALQRVDSTDVPITALKGYIGHTMGAAGIVETILCMRSTDENMALATCGYEELGVSVNLKLSPDHQKVRGRSFIKMLSGFGGCNAVVLCIREEKASDLGMSIKPVLKRGHSVHLTAEGVEVDGSILKTNSSGIRLLTELYKSHINNYPKYYKMDGLSRLGFVAAELVLRAEGNIVMGNAEERGVVLFNRSSSVDTDRKYLSTICDQQDYYPSPSLFVYTLPNIVTSEIAIRNGYHGETCLYVLGKRDERLIRQVVNATFGDKSIGSLITGWLDYEDDEHFEADIYIVEKQQKQQI